MVSGREERYQLDPKSAGVGRGDGEVVRSRGLNRARFQGEGVLLPFGVHAADRGGCERLSRVIAYETDGDWSERGRIGFGVKGSVVSGVGMEVISPPAGIENSGRALRVRLGDLDFLTGSQSGAGAAGWIMNHFRDRVSALIEVPVVNAAPVADEGAVADHLSVEPSVIGVVDFFGHEAV